MKQLCWKTGKHIAAHCATALGSFVSHERVTMSPLGRERPDGEQQGDALTVKPTSAQNSLHVFVCTPSQMGPWWFGCPAPFSLLLVSEKHSKQMHIYVCS